MTYWFSLSTEVPKLFCFKTIIESSRGVDAGAKYKELNRRIYKVDNIDKEMSNAYDNWRCYERSNYIRSDLI